MFRTVTAEGNRRGFLVGLGACCGVLIWGGGVAVGLGALLAAWQLGYTVMRWIGAAYLCYLGIGMLVRPRHAFKTASDQSRSVHALPRRNWFLRGLFTNLLNPKVGVFYVTFLPQFVPAHVNAPLFMVSLAGIHALEGVVWFAVLVTVARLLTVMLRRPTVVRTLDRVTGIVLVGFGMRLIAESRD